MNKRHAYRFKVWGLMIGMIIVWTIGSGVYRNSIAGSEETYKGLKLFSDVLDLIEKNYVDEVDSEKMIQKAIQGMVQSLDPHSQLLPPEAFEELQVDTRGEFGGIGIVISMEKGVLKVVSPIEGTPAYKAGIVSGDIIVKVDDEPTKEMLLWEAVKKMRGPKGTSVKISIAREGEPKLLDFTLVRDIIPIISVKSVLLKPDYGYVWVTNFREDTSEDLKKILLEFEAKNPPIKGLILDLRNNPGGLLPEAIKVADLFIADGNILSINGRIEKQKKVYKAHPIEAKRDYPIIVLINGGSASASEIVAGALQDHKRAVLLGTTSFGKGTVQTVEPLRDGYGLKFTIARYYTPNGRSIQAKGIVPDIVVQPGLVETGEREGEEQQIKEADLKNHLEGKPLEKKPALKMKADKESSKSDDEKKKEEEVEQRNRFRHGPLKAEDLLKDRQVKRALEILVGYDIFQSIQK